MVAQLLMRRADVNLQTPLEIDFADGLKELRPNPHSLKIRKDDKAMDAAGVLHSSRRTHKDCTEPNNGRSPLENPAISGLVDGMV